MAFLNFVEINLSFARAAERQTDRPIQQAIRDKGQDRWSCVFNEWRVNDFGKPNHNTQFQCNYYVAWADVENDQLQCLYYCYCGDFSSA